MGRAERLEVEVVYAPAPGVVDLVALELPTGATLAHALRAAGIVERHALVLEGLRVGVWGRVQPLEARLRDRDRVEVYRPLVVDPKEARRLRYRKAR